MKAQEIISKIAVLLGVENKNVEMSSQKGLLKGTTITVYTNDFKRNNPVYKMEGENKSLLEDGEYEVELATEEGAKDFRLVIANGLLSRFDLLPPKAVMMEEAPAEEEKKPEEEVAMAIEDRVAALEAMVAELISKLQEMMPEKEDESEVEIEAGKKEEMMSKQEEVTEEVELAAQKKFTGAPVDEAKLMKNLLKNPAKQEGTVESVFSRMASWDVKALKGTF